MKNILMTVAFVFCALNGLNAQLSVNDYKYVIVEKQFHFQNEANEYDLNRMVKFLFRKHGFKTIIEGESLPADLKSNYCLALNSEVTARGALRTKAKVVLTDCDNNVVFTSEEGITKEKDFKRAYELSIRNTFESFSKLNYHYIPNERVLSQGRAATEEVEAIETKEEIAQLKAEIKDLKEEKSEITEPIKQVEAEISVQEMKSESDDPKVIKKDKEKPNIFYAKADSNTGFLLVTDGDSNIVMTLIPSGKDDVYLVKDKNAIVFLEAGKWQYSETKNGQRMTKEMNIKF